MPLKVNPEQLVFDPYAKGDKSLFQLPFKEQIAFFQGKANLLLETERWDDVLKSAHDRAFMVAGAAKADLLSDLYQAVQKTIDQGGTLEGFRKDFAKTVQKTGWDYKGAFDWRTRVIYQTNLATSYAAGRWAQLTHPDLLKNRPYWQYIHNDTVQHPRPLHVKWNGLTLRHDDPWWQTHFPPGGWGCRCRVKAVRNPTPGKDTAPVEGTYEHIDSQGEVHQVPVGIDYGWDYAPGRSNAELVRKIIDKHEGAQWQLARANVQALVNSDVFRSFFHGSLDGEFPIAVLDPAEQALLGSESRVVLLSRQSIESHVSRHPEVGVDDYARVQIILDEGEVYRQGDDRLVYLFKDGVWWRAALKRTQDGKKNYFLTLFRDDKGKPPKGAVKIER